ncbi:MAG: exosome complex RNA-binding protein Csl4 [archaeon]
MDKDIVIPGEFIAYEEEFLEGKNTVNADGRIYSTTLGTLDVDEKNRLVNVKKARDIEKLKVGAVITGTVAFVRDNVVSIRMAEAHDGKTKLVLSSGSAFLKVSNVSTSYIESLKQHFKIGDIVQAVVTEIKPFGIQLRTNDPNLGVVKAFCSKCRSAMHLSHEKLQCLNCGSVELRKLSSEYAVK